MMQNVKCVERFIFLDIDGVLNGSRWKSRRPPPPPGTPLFSTYELNPDSCRVLEDVCQSQPELTGIVITSTWRWARTNREISEMLLEMGVTAPVIGRTPEMESGGRGDEVSWWLQTHLPHVDDLCRARFVCLDDENTYGDMQGKLVQTRSEVGLSEIEVPYINYHLSQTLMDSRAAGGIGRVFLKSRVELGIPRRI